MGWLTVVCGGLICLRQLSEWRMLGLLRLLVLPLCTGNVMLSAHICLSAEEGVGWGWRGCGHWMVCVGGGGTSGSLRLFPVAVDTRLLACVPLTFPFNPSGSPGSSLSVSAGWNQRRRLDLNSGAISLQAPSFSSLYPLRFGRQGQGLECPLLDWPKNHHVSDLFQAPVVLLMHWNAKSLEKVICSVDKTLTCFLSLEYLMRNLKTLKRRSNALHWGGAIPDSKQTNI